MSTTHVWVLIQQWMDAQFFRVSQSQLADKLGVSRSAVSQWKTGQSRPTPANLRELHKVTRIPYDDLVEAVVQDLGYRDEGTVEDDTPPMNDAEGTSATDEQDIGSGGGEKGGPPPPSDIESILAPGKQAMPGAPGSKGKRAPKGRGARRT